MAVAPDAMPPAIRPAAIGRDQYAVAPVDLARALLGLRLVASDADGLSGGIIVETEAYGGPDDRASHARAGLTRRTAPMFGPPGHAYVYLVYGMHECLNVVAGHDGEAGAVLLRALEPTIGLELIRRRRGRPADPPHRLASGPARLAQALGVTRALDGHDLTLGQRLWLEPADQPQVGDREIVSGPRIGVAYAAEPWASMPWRYWLAGSPAVSRAGGTRLRRQALSSRR